MQSLTSQIILAFTFGAVFIVTLIVLAIKFPTPTPFQYATFRITLALAAAGVAAVIPGFINLEGNPTAGLMVRSGGALAIFVIVYFFNPAQWVTTSEDPQPLDQVAAVCYRPAGASIEFLLVKTTGGRWTFPKGNLDAGEERWFAAEREAFEEAGATGDIEHEPFTTYLHEKKEWKGKGIKIRIQAFLLKVKKTQAPESKRRKPTWFSAADAENALAEDRQFKYAQEFRRVVRVAVGRLGNVSKP